MVTYDIKYEFVGGKHSYPYRLHFNNQITMVLKHIFSEGRKQDVIFSGLYRFIQFKDRDYALMIKLLFDGTEC